MEERSDEELDARVVEVEPPADWETPTSRDFNDVRLPERSEPFLHVLRDDVRRFVVSLSPWINGLPLAAFPVGFEDRTTGSPRPVGAMLGGLPYAEDR